MAELQLDMEETVTDLILSQVDDNQIPSSKKEEEGNPQLENSNKDDSPTIIPNHLRNLSITSDVEHVYGEPSPVPENDAAYINTGYEENEIKEESPAVKNGPDKKRNARRSTINRKKQNDTVQSIAQDIPPTSKKTPKNLNSLEEISKQFEIEDFDGTKIHLSESDIFPVEVSSNPNDLRSSHSSPTHRSKSASDMTFEQKTPGESLVDLENDPIAKSSLKQTKENERENQSLDDNMSRFASVVGSDMQQEKEKKKKKKKASCCCCCSWNMKILFWIHMILVLGSAFVAACLIYLIENLVNSGITFIDALFTTVSCITITGLGVVDFSKLTYISQSIGIFLFCFYGATIFTSPALFVKIAIAATKLIWKKMEQFEKSMQREDFHISTSQTQQDLGTVNSDSQDLHVSKSAESDHGDLPQSKTMETLSQLRNSIEEFVANNPTAANEKNDAQILDEKYSQAPKIFRFCFCPAICVAKCSLGCILKSKLLTYCCFLCQKRQSLRWLRKNQMDLDYVEVTALSVLFALITLTSVLHFLVIGLVLLLYFAIFYEADDFGGLSHLWVTIFLTVSSWNNVGMSPFPDSLVRFSKDIFLVIFFCSTTMFLTIMTPLFIRWEISFLYKFSGRYSIAFRYLLSNHHKVSIFLFPATQTRIFFVTSIILQTAGALITVVLDTNNDNLFPSDASYIQRIFAEVFHNVACRNVGFNMLDMSKMSMATILFIIFEMRVKPQMFCSLDDEAYSFDSVSMNDSEKLKKFKKKVSILKKKKAIEESKQKSRNRRRRLARLGKPTSYAERAEAEGSNPKNDNKPSEGQKKIKKAIEQLEETMENLNPPLKNEYKDSLNDNIPSGRVSLSDIQREDTVDDFPQIFTQVISTLKDNEREALSKQINKLGQNRTEKVFLDNINSLLQKSPKSQFAETQPPEIVKTSLSDPNIIPKTIFMPSPPQTYDPTRETAPMIMISSTSSAPQPEGTDQQDHTGGAFNDILAGANVPEAIDLTKFTPPPFNPEDDITAEDINKANKKKLQGPEMEKFLENAFVTKKVPVDQVAFLNNYKAKKRQEIVDQQPQINKNGKIVLKKVKSSKTMEFINITDGDLGLSYEENTSLWLTLLFKSCSLNLVTFFNKGVSIVFHIFKDNNLWILVSMVLILAMEKDKTSSDPLSFSALSLFFEIISAFGNVGMSLGYPGLPGFSSVLGTPSKLIIMSLMLLGKHRGLLGSMQDQDLPVKTPEEILFQKQRKQYLKLMALRKLRRRPKYISSQI